MTPEGNFEGHNILNRLKSGSATADEENYLVPLRSETSRSTRRNAVRPGLDDKVLADWNGLMIAALANAGAVLNESAWIDMAEHAFRFVADAMTRDNRLGHSWRAGGLLFPGLSSDYGSMIRAALALHRGDAASGAYLDRAVRWQALLDAHHADAEDGGYFLTADDGGEPDSPAQFHERRRHPKSARLDRAEPRFGSQRSQDHIPIGKGPIACSKSCCRSRQPISSATRRSYPHSIRGCVSPKSS